MNPKKERALEALHNRHSDPEKFLANLPAFLRSGREHYQLTQKELATQSYQAYESGKSIPTLPNFIRLADFFDVSLDEMIGRNSD